MLPQYYTPNQQHPHPYPHQYNSLPPRSPRKAPSQSPIKSSSPDSYHAKIQNGSYTDANANLPLISGHPSVFQQASSTVPRNFGSHGDSSGSHMTSTLPRDAGRMVTMATAGNGSDNHSALHHHPGISQKPPLNGSQQLQQQQEALPTIPRKRGFSFGKGFFKKPGKWSNSAPNLGDACPKSSKPAATSMLCMLLIHGLYIVIPVSLLGLYFLCFESFSLLQVISWDSFYMSW